MPTRKKTRKKARSKTAAGRRPQKSTVQRIQDELPAELRAYAKRVQQGLSRLEKQIETAQRDARKRFTRLLRDVSHQLGGIEAEGERQWRRRTARARHEAVKLLRRLEQTLDTKTSKAKKAVRSARRKVAGRRAPRKAVARRAPAAAAPRPAVAAPPKPAAPYLPKPVAATPLVIQPKPPTPATPTSSGSGSTLPRSGS